MEKKNEDSDLAMTNALSLESALQLLDRTLRRHDFEVAVEEAERQAEIEVVRQVINACTQRKLAAERPRSTRYNEILNLTDSRLVLPTAPPNSAFGPEGETLRLNLQLDQSTPAEFTVRDKEVVGDPKKLKVESRTNLPPIVIPLSPIVYARIVSSGLMSGHPLNLKNDRAAKKIKSGTTKLQSNSVIGLVHMATTSQHELPFKQAPSMTTPSVRSTFDEFVFHHSASQEITSHQSVCPNSKTESTKVVTNQPEFSPCSPDSSSQSTERNRKFDDADDATAKDLPSLMFEVEWSVRTY